MASVDDNSANMYLPTETGPNQYACLSDVSSSEQQQSQLNECQPLLHQVLPEDCKSTSLQHNPLNISYLLNLHRNWKSWSLYQVFVKQEMFGTHEYLYHEHVFQGKLQLSPHALENIQD